MELSQLQLKILNAPCNRSIVISSAASGKTRLLTEKVRQILRAGTNPKTIAVITFTNMAAAELRTRLGSDYKDGLFVGTIHALANYFLLSAGIKTDKVIDDERFDELFKMVKKNPLCIRHLDWILLDEAQDSDERQFEFLFDMINPDYFFICGDPKQSIYQWKGSDPTLMMKLSKVEGAQIFEMNENYRNGSNILTYAKRIISRSGLIDSSRALRMNGTVSEIPYSPAAILQRLEDEANYNEWAILCRTNSEISSISKNLAIQRIPYDTFKQGDLSREELITKMHENTVKVLTIHSSKGLEWNNVIVIGVRYSSAEELNVGYVAATRARDNLIWMYYQPAKARRPRIEQW